MNTEELEQNSFLTISDMGMPLDQANEKGFFRTSWALVTVPGRSQLTAIMSQKLNDAEVRAEPDAGLQKR